jgi:thiol-disulfide isomerase/thioredoxin
MLPFWKKRGAWLAIAAGLVFVSVTVAALTLFRGSTPTAAVMDPQGVYVEGDVVSPALPLVPAPGFKGGTLADYSGKVLLLNFWAGWCGPCLKEMPSLYKLHEKYASRGFAVITFNMDDVAADGLAALERTAGKAPFPLYVGYEQAVFRHFPVEGLPFTAILDRTGKVTYALPGERDWMDAASQKLIEDHL